MHQYKIIFSKLLKEARIQKKYTFLFVIAIAVIVGLVIPYMAGNISFRVQSYSIAIFSAVLLRQWAAESFASEKENKTLESLLSTCIEVEILFRGKMIFNYVLASLVEYVLIIVFFITNIVLKISMSILLSEFIMLIVMHAMIKLFLAQRITWISLNSKDVRTANSYASKYLFATIFLLSMIISLKVTGTEHLFSIYLFIAALGCLINLYTFKKIDKAIGSVYIKGLWR